MRPASRQARGPGSAQKSPFNMQKENSNNNNNNLYEKKRRIGRDVFGARVMPEPRVRLRQAFSFVNVRQENMVENATPKNGSISGGSENSIPTPMTREEVENLLNMKIKGKNKFDYKGKSEQMMFYIKKLRGCIHWLQELERTSTHDRDQIRAQLLHEQKDRQITEEMLKCKHDALETRFSELRATCAGLEAKVLKTKSETEAVLCARQSDAEALRKVEVEHCQVVQERDIALKEKASANQQVASLQDINKRLQEYNNSLQHYNGKLQSDAAKMTEAICKLQKEKTTMEETLRNLRGHATSLQEQLDQAKSTIQDGSRQREALKEEVEELRMRLQFIKKDIDEKVALVESLTMRNEHYKECNANLSAEMEALTNKTLAMERSYSLQDEQRESLLQKLEDANHKLEIAEKSALLHRSDGAEKGIKVEELQRRLDEAEIQIHEGELLRKRLHNTILELKGNIRVFCRVRPLLLDDNDDVNGGSDNEVVHYPTSTELLGRGIEIEQNQGQKHAFTFDKVFGPEVSQEGIFVEISQLIQSALDGYKVCIFAYGQTGSGKTHTMLGNPKFSELKGIIPRSLEQIFEASQDLNARGWNFRMEASMLEIYNESIRDLLVSENPPRQHVVKHDSSGNTVVSDLTLVEVTSWKQVSSLLHCAAQTRSVGKTAMNEVSSRSHCVFTLRISGRNESTEEQVHGILNLIDLAGSERLSRSGSTGDRLKETQAINKSLACLGDVIMAIANKEQHIPYRNSKLTYLLQPCLGGDSKTLMFVNISPDSMSVSETLCSLRFAAKVNACEIGVPRRHTVDPLQRTRLSSTTNLTSNGVLPLSSPNNPHCM